MSRATLVLECARGGYEWWIIWIIDGDSGATLGEDTYTEKDLAKAKPGDWEHVAATIAVSKTEGVTRLGVNGYRWESEEDAKKALRAAKAAIKDKSKKPWPEWATKAVANGWNPPKGWTP